MSAGTRHFVATRELHAFRTAHMMVRAEGMQLKHRSKTPGPGAADSAAIPWIDQNQTFCNRFEPEGIATSLDAVFGDPPPLELCGKLSASKHGQTGRERHRSASQKVPPGRGVKDPR